MNENIETRQEKIKRLKDIIAGRQETKVFFCLEATDGQLYRDKELVTITYRMTFQGEHAFSQWKQDNGIEGIAHIPDTRTNTIVVDLKTEHEPIEGAKPRKNAISFPDHNMKPNEAFVEREAILAKLCIEYAKHPPKGFEIIRQPYFDWLNHC